MKDLLDWQLPEVVNIYDELSLWSAPFGRLLLENIPMQDGASVLDLGFGTGFPLIELSQRFGEGARIIGIDIWSAAVQRTKEKIRVLGIENIEVMEQSATSIALENESIDLVTSNLGINNFDDKRQVYAEVFRVLKPEGRLCITTNPVGTFQELFDVFAQVLSAMKLHHQVQLLQQHVAHRNTEAQIVEELTAHGFQLARCIEDQTRLRFANAKAVLDHGLIRIGFRAAWENWLAEDQQARFFEQLIIRLEDCIRKTGTFEMAIPMLYLEFGKMRA